MKTILLKTSITIFKEIFRFLRAIRPKQWNSIPKSIKETKFTQFLGKNLQEKMHLQDKSNFKLW